jgi:hypothetical protein
MVAADEGEPAREPRDGRPVLARVRAGADVAEQESPVLGRDGAAPVPDQGPVHLADVGGEERPGGVERDPGVAEVEVGEEPGLPGGVPGAASRTSAARPQDDPDGAIA